MAVPLVLVQLVLAVAAWVRATCRVALILEHTTVLLGVTLHVSLTRERFDASITSPARSSVVIHVSGARTATRIRPGAGGGGRRESAVNSSGQAQGLRAEASILGPRTGSIVCSGGSRKASEREETLIDSGGVGVIPSIATPMTDRAGVSDVVNRIETFVGIANIGSKSSVIALIVDWVGRKIVVNTMKAIVGSARKGCKPSGVSPIVDCTGSTDIIDRVESTAGTTFTGIVPLTIVSNGSGETTQRAEATVDGILNSVIAPTTTGSSHGAERAKTMVDTRTIGTKISILGSVVAHAVGWTRVCKVVEAIETSAIVIIVSAIGAIASILNGIIALVVGYVGASEVGDAVVRPVVVGVTGVQLATRQFSVSFFLLTQAQLQNPACAEHFGASFRPSLGKGRSDVIALQLKGARGSGEGRPMRRSGKCRNGKAIAKKSRKWTGEPGHLMLFGVRRIGALAQIDGSKELKSNA